MERVYRLTASSFRVASSAANELSHASSLRTGCDGTGTAGASLDLLQFNHIQSPPHNGSLGMDIAPKNYGCQFTASSSASLTSASASAFNSRRTCTNFESGK